MERAGSAATGKGYWQRVLVVDLEQGTSCDKVLDVGAVNGYDDITDWDRSCVPTVETVRGRNVAQVSTVSPTPEG